jgi:hypothetical protein
MEDIRPKITPWLSTYQKWKAWATIKEITRGIQSWDQTENLLGGGGGGGGGGRDTFYEVAQQCW